jgi:hypothetical protein
LLYKGSCHCGKVAFEFEGDVEGAVACNCSICAKKGALLWAVPREKLRLLTPETELSRYTFNTHSIVHRFCKTCGMHPFAENKGSEPEAYVNLRCVEGVDLASLPVTQFDGRAL